MGSSRRLRPSTWRSISSRPSKEQKTDGELGPGLEIRRAAVAGGQRDVAVKGIGENNSEFTDQRVLATEEERDHER